MKRYVMLFFGVIAIGLALIVGSRLVRVPSSSRATAPGSSGVDVSLTITPDYHIDPEVVTVPKDARVRLTVTNRYRLTVSLALMGYQDRIAAAYVPSDSVWRGEFVADRPGEDFAWMLEGTPVGRLRVTGSHLVEGHR